MKKFFILTVFLFLNLILPVFSAENNIEYMNMKWWENFSDEKLCTHLLTLYEKNYDIKNAALKIKENEQAVKMQFAQEMPYVSFNGTLSRDFQAPREKMGDLVIPKYSQNNYNLPLTMGYEIDIWGKNRLQTKAKEEELEIIKQFERALYISLTSDFSADYFNLIKADEIIKIQDEIIKVQEEILSKTKEKHKAGLSNINEPIKEEKLLTLLKEEHNLHLKTRDVLIETLKVYLSGDSEDISRGEYDNVVLINNIPEKYSTEIISNRPDYLMEEANIKKAGINVQVAKREFLPNFTIFGQIGLNAYNLGSLFKSPSQFLNAGILPDIDLFSGGRKRAFLKMQKYRYETALNDYQKTFLNGMKDVNSSLIEYKTAYKNYNEAKARLLDEEKVYNLALDKYEIGASSKLSTLYAREEYLNAKKDVVSNKINVIIATIGLYKAAGGVNLCEVEKL